LLFALAVGLRQAPRAAAKAQQRGAIARRRASEPAAAGRQRERHAAAVAPFGDDDEPLPSVVRTVWPPGDGQRRR
jgi:hypothetical protein